LVLLLVKLPAAAEYTWAILTYPFQVDDSEGVILSEARWLARGVDPYQRARPDFFTAAPYTPLYTLLNAAAFSVGPFTFKVGRGLALLATLAIGLGAGALIRWRTGSRLLGLWAALAILTLNLVSVWSVRARPDHLALALNLAGLALIWWRWPGDVEGGAWSVGRGMWAGREADQQRTPLPAATPDAPRSTLHAPRPALDRGEGRVLALAAGLFALGFFTKQTLLAAPLAAGLYLLIVRPGLGLRFGALYGAAVLAPFLALDLVTRGGFYQHIVAFHRSWSAHDFLTLWLPFVARHWPLLLVAAALPATVAAGFARRDRRTEAARDLLPALYGLTAALAGLGAGTHGGNHNHFVETLVAAVLCAALVAGRLANAERGMRAQRGSGARHAESPATGAPAGEGSPRQRGKPSALARGALAGLLPLALSGLLLAEGRLGRPDWLARDFRPPRPAEREGLAQVAAFVTNDPGPVYSDNVGLLLVAGKEVRYTDPFSLAYAARTGQWDQGALVQRVGRGEFSLIVLRYDIFAPSAEGGPPTDLTPELYAAIRARYRTIESNVLYLYAPR
jgi:hypothetical protein